MNMNNGRKQDRQKEAIERQEVRTSLSDQKQLDKLDVMFGEGKGATKERKRLAARIEKGGKK